MHFLHGQTVAIEGQLIADGEVVGIHILNHSSQKFTIASAKGQFSIPAKLNDTLVISGISYELETVIINSQILKSKKVTISLTEKINLLDEVVVGSVLSGNLNADLANSGIEPAVNFYNFGIPGYAGKPKTQTERRLYTAGDFKPIHLLGLLAGSLEVDPIINAISGRTKMLKKRVKHESKEQCLFAIKEKHSKILFSEFPLEVEYHIDFFYFCADDPQFESICSKNIDFETFSFLKENLLTYMKLPKPNLPSEN